jgi:hypothetical protein
MILTEIKKRLPLRFKIWIQTRKFLSQAFKDKLLLRYLALWEKTGKLKYLKRLRIIIGIQLSVKQLEAILTQIKQKKDCQLLVFGLGNDSFLWANANQTGQTVFLEEHQVWFNEFKSRYPHLSAEIVSYNTKMRDWKIWLNQPEKLTLDLKQEILQTQWDIILVDAPVGYHDDAPGRMKSIYTASQLIHQNGDIFVHDCEREVERVYCDTFLLSKNLVKEITNLRHYRFSSSL